MNFRKFVTFWKLNTCIVSCMWHLKHCFYLSHLYIHTHTCTQTYTHTQTHTHTHTHTNTHSHSHSHRLKLCIFLERSWKQIHEHTDPRNLIQVKFKIFNKNIRSNKDSGQIERKKLTYLHYLNKMIGKYKLRKFIFSEVSCF